MATPNIVNVATINAKNAAANLTGTSRTEAIDIIGFFLITMIKL